MEKAKKPVNPTIAGELRFIPKNAAFVQFKCQSAADHPELDTECPASYGIT